jgi:hypothetical protein
VVRAIGIMCVNCDPDLGHCRNTNAGGIPMLGSLNLGFD